ncbi:hypothetical protein CEXT_128701 [Caerostris extrusa]|uniref:LAGLIDADG homing endonuclease n=1 Tax=Caerostris extrusa TaxID=172846 RepID=A0AAV4V5N2_CAEEX|nr:hypothetical protein CEXT_128701 [Caerostris extrusa]
MRKEERRKGVHTFRLTGENGMRPNKSLWLLKDGVHCPLFLSFNTYGGIDGKVQTKLRVCLSGHSLNWPITPVLRTLASRRHPHWMTRRRPPSIAWLDTSAQQTVHSDRSCLAVSYTTTYAEKRTQIRRELNKIIKKKK